MGCWWWQKECLDGNAGNHDRKLKVWGPVHCRGWLCTVCTVHCTHLYIARLQYKCVQRKSAESTPSTSVHSRHNASKPMRTPGTAGLPVLGWHARKVNRALLPFHSNHNKVPQIALLTDFKYLKPCVTLIHRFLLTALPVVLQFGMHQIWRFWRYCIYCHLSWFY